MNHKPKISVIIPTYNEEKDIPKCLGSLLKQSYTDFEVLLVDNCSNDGSADYVRKNFPQVKVFKNPDNMGYGGGNSDRSRGSP